MISDSMPSTMSAMMNVSCIYSVKELLGCLCPALVVTYKPIGFLYEMEMSLHDTADGGGYSLCKSISDAKSSDARGIFQLLWNQNTLHRVSAHSLAYGTADASLGL